MILSWKLLCSKNFYAIVCPSVNLRSGNNAFCVKNVLTCKLAGYHLPFGISTDFMVFWRGELTFKNCPPSVAPGRMIFEISFRDSAPNRFVESRFTAAFNAIDCYYAVLFYPRTTQ